jgi:hypothetical protein
MAKQSNNLATFGLSDKIGYPVSVSSGCRTDGGKKSTSNQYLLLINK